MYSTVFWPASRHSASVSPYLYILSLASYWVACPTSERDPPTSHLQQPWKTGNGMFPHWRLATTSHQQLIGNTPHSCTSSSTQPAHTDQPTQCSWGQQGASQSHTHHSPDQRDLAAFHADVQFLHYGRKWIEGWMAQEHQQHEQRLPCPQRKRHRGSKQHLSFNLCWKTLYPPWGAGAEAAQGESGKRSTGVMEIAWRGFQLWGYCSESGPVVTYTTPISRPWVDR